MKMLIIFILILITLPAFCPTLHRADILQPEPIRYDPILRAFMFVESSFRTDVVNSLGYAGILQIGQKMIDEANRINRLQGNHIEFFISDALDSTKSVAIWYTVQNYKNPAYNARIAARIWNPTASKKYYQKIKANL